MPLEIQDRLPRVPIDLGFASVNRNSWGGDPESLGQIDLPITPETSHYLFTINIDRAICNFTDNIGSTLDEICPKRPTINRNWWKFTPEIAKLIKVKRKVRRMLKEDQG